MHTRLKLLALFVLVGALAAPPVQAKVQLGDLLKKVTGKNKDQDKDKARPKDSTTAKEQATSALQGGARDAAAKDTSSVDDFIDANNDGVDDRKQPKVRRDRPHETPARTPPAAKERTPKGQRDTAKTRPPR